MSLRFIRLLVAIALALAVPLQGFAGAAAGICMTFAHHDEAPAQSHGADPDGDHHHPSGKQGDAHCAPCAACCAAAAIASALVMPDSGEGAGVLNAHDPRGFASIPLRPVDRPPLAL